MVFILDSTVEANSLSLDFDLKLAFLVGEGERVENDYIINL